MYTECAIDHGKYCLAGQVLDTLLKSFHLRFFDACFTLLTTFSCKTLLVTALNRQITGIAMAQVSALACLRFPPLLFTEGLQNLLSLAQTVGHSMKPTFVDWPAVVRCVMTIQEVHEGVSQAFQPNQAANPAQEAAPSQGPAGPAPTGAGQQAAAPRTLWSEAAELAEARERSQWHELMSRRNIEQNEKLQVKLSLLTSAFVDAARNPTFRQ